MKELTYSVVWRPFMGGSEVLAEGLTIEQAKAEIASLPPLPPLGGSYGMEVEVPYPDGDAPCLGGK